jgi:dihydroneopterin aldolase
MPSAPLDHIELRGIRAMATHGVLAEERLRPQPFEVDIDLQADLASAGQSDCLSSTVDYAALCEAAWRALVGPPANLLEHLAERVAASVLEVAGPTAESVTVSVRKLRPPIGVELESAGVTIVRRRSGAPPAC